MIKSLFFEGLISNLSVMSEDFSRSSSSQDGAGGASLHDENNGGDLLAVCCALLGPVCERHRPLRGQRAAARAADRHSGNSDAR